MSITPEQRFILATLAETDRRVRNFSVGYLLCGASLQSPAYQVERADIVALIRAGYLRRDPGAGGHPELTDQGRALVTA